MRNTLTWVLAAILGFGFAQTALAADLPVKAPVKVAPVAVPFSWTGLYAGIDAGYAWSKIGMSIPAVPAVGTAEAKPKGFTFGGHLNYLYQFNNPIVIGAEGDISWLDGDATGSFPGFPTQGVSASQKWDASVRGVLGAAFDRVLVYGTGGWSWLHIDGCGFVFATNTCFPGTDISGTHDGWTAGGGIAYAITPNVVVRVEYLHADYGTVTIAGTGFNGGIADVSEKTDKIRAGLSIKLWGPGGLIGN